MKKILVPTDFSETANKARDYAIQLAQTLNAEIILLNSFHIPNLGDYEGALINLDYQIKEEAEKQMKEQMKYVKLNYANIKFSEITTLGLVVDAIQTVCEEQKINLIVMGTTGATGFIGNLLGSNTASLIGSVKTPIVAVPSNATINFPNHIVVANDLMESGENKIFNPLKEIAIGTGSTIDFLYIVNGDEQANRKLQQLKAANFDEKFDAQYHPFHIKNEEEVEDGILEFIDKKEVDLLVVVARQRGFWEKLFHKSISKALVKQAKLPILVLAD
ncbi:MAG: hypothetical protein CO118_11650 [Flavobacteriales bacterium CG_4_9_14_3_um_filter_32_8]|nr:MAG: hypothetical protein CO118_11650 [Flavobacteriales bacterium CG_4_9_14_3_um_filter_32_8]